MKKLLLISLIALSATTAKSYVPDDNYNTLMQQAEAGQHQVDQSILAMTGVAKTNAIMRLKTQITNLLASATPGSAAAAIAAGKAAAFNADFPGYAIL